MNYPLLTSPITVGNIRLKNRMAMSPMATYGMANADGSSNERHRAYYEARARGGLGLIRTEATLVHPSGKSWPHQLAIFDDHFIPGLRQLAQAIKQHGAAAILQLHHGGAFAAEALTGHRPLAPSPRPAFGHTAIPDELTIEQIEQLEAAFAEGARRAREAGFDGVELHMGTAYLILSFVSPAQNLRQDAYGRDFEGRMRFPLRVVEKIRALAGPDFPIGARIVGTDYYDGGVDIAYCQQVARKLADAGLAYLDVSAGQGPHVRRLSPLTMGSGEAVFADYAAAVKSVVSIPVMNVGRYLSLAAGEAVLAAGKADLVVFGRALLADPELVVKSVRGDESKVIPCCGFDACFAIGHENLGTSCLLNPETGNEHELRLSPARQPRRLLVLGSGVPGLELARMAALRGHHVTVVTNGLPFGGLHALRAEVPYAREIERAVGYFRRLLSDLGIEVLDQVPDRPFDLTVDARPGTPLYPSVTGLDSSEIVQAEHLLAGTVPLETVGDHVVVVGSGLFAGETALYLAEAGKRVTLVADEPRIMADAYGPVATRTELRLADRGVRSIAAARLLRFEAGTLFLEVNGAPEAVGSIGRLVAALGWQQPPPDGVVAHTVADAWEPLAAAKLTAAATRLARQV
jgi:2,4-dienoyl-CoA reductase-like NADH-dependent reductase (Old Yellow Enzyme family)